MQSRSGGEGRQNEVETKRTFIEPNVFDTHTGHTDRD